MMTGIYVGDLNLFFFSFQSSQHIKRKRNDEFFFLSSATTTPTPFSWAHWWCALSVYQSFFIFLKTRARLFFLKIYFLIWLPFSFSPSISQLLLLLAVGRYLTFISIFFVLSHLTAYEKSESFYSIPAATYPSHYRQTEMNMCEGISKKARQPKYKKKKFIYLFIYIEKRKKERRRWRNERTNKRDFWPSESLTLSSISFFSLSLHFLFLLYKTISFLPVW